MNARHGLVCLLVPDLVWQVVLEPVLHLLLGLEVVPLLYEFIYSLQNLL